MRIANLPEEVKHRVGIEGGSLSVSHGTHEVLIPLSFTAQYVHTSISGRGGTGCGQSPVDSVIWSPDAYGLLLVLEIQSDSAEVEWFASKERVA